MQGQNVRLTAQTRLQPAPHALDLPGARKEDEQVTALLSERPEHGRLHCQEWIRRGAFRVADLDGKAAALGGDNGRPAQQPRRGLGVQGGGHDEDAQVRAQGGRGVQGQGQPQVGLEAALVELVEDEESDPIEARIPLDAPGEDALGDHLDAGAGSDAPLESDLVADGLSPRGSPSEGRHAGGGHARSRTARLQHQDAPARRARARPAAGGGPGWSCPTRAGR